MPAQTAKRTPFVVDSFFGSLVDETRKTPTIRRTSAIIAKKSEVNDSKRKKTPNKKTTLIPTPTHTGNALDIPNSLTAARENTFPTANKKPDRIANGESINFEK